MAATDRVVAAVALFSVFAPVLGAQKPGAPAAFFLMAVGVNDSHHRVAELNAIP